jgi:hypothetical protein
MKSDLRNSHGSNSDLSRKIPEGMLRAVDRKFGRLITEARKEWERKFAGSDPSDTCVTVRISAGESRDLSRMFPLKHSRTPEPFVTN